MEISTAVKALVERLDSNKGSSIVVNSCVPRVAIISDQNDLDLLDHDEIFTDKSVKRSASAFSDQIGSQSKRLKSCRLSPRSQVAGKDPVSLFKMGRKSNGNTNNESKNLDSKRRLPRIELARSTPGVSFKTPTSFAEAAAIASIKLKLRNEVSPEGVRQIISLAPRNIFCSPVSALAVLIKIATLALFHWYLLQTLLCPMLAALLRVTSPRECYA